MNSLNGKIQQTKTTNTTETGLHQSAMLRGNERQSDCTRAQCFVAMNGTAPERNASWQ